MKLNKNNAFIVISTAALIAVLIIQVNWIFRTAGIKEDMFNEKADLVLARATDALLSDKSTCKSIQDSIVKNNIEVSAKLGKAEISKIDSLISHYMRFYNFHVDYSFQILSPRFGSQDVRTFKNSRDPAQQGCYEGKLEDAVSTGGFRLKLNFPEKKQFIAAEMSSMFITSVILIVIVLSMFWLTIISLIKERRASEHTTDFLNNMTHEFKTPLTNIALAGKMIVKDSNISQEEKIRHYSSIILEENEKLQLQVEQVLSMTALEKGEIPLQSNELDVHQLIHDSSRSVRLQIDHRNGYLITDLKAENVMIRGDRTHLTNALINIIDNGIKYSQEKPEISIITYNIEKELIIEISDKGIGIEPEYHSRIFDKFFRVPTGNVHDVKGFGLGLAYVKRIIELQGGIIELYSEKEKGTTFKITLPNA